MIESKIISKQELQSLLDKDGNSPRQIVLTPPSRYKRGAEKSQRIWVDIKCEEHGAYSTPIRLDTLIKQRNRCYQCGLKRQVDKRTRSENQIKESVKYWAKKRNFPVSFVSVSEDRKTTFLNCKRHGNQKKRTSKVVDQGTLCNECANENWQPGNYLSFEEKVSLYKKRYDPPRVKLIRETEEKGEKYFKKLIVYECQKCNLEKIATWNAIYGSGHKKDGLQTCEDCRVKKIPVFEISKRLKNFGIELVNPEEYQDTHKPTNLRCLKCRIVKKNIKVNTIFSRKGGISCHCTRAIPNICHDYIFNCISKLFKNSKSRYKIPKTKSEADIFIPEINTILEIKYGDNCFGREKGSGEAYKRYKHCVEQANIYNLSGYKIIYFVVGLKNNIYEIPEEIRKFKLLFLDSDDLFSGLVHFDKETINTLNLLYKTPYKIRTIDVVESEEKHLIRKRLKKYLEQNGYKYPSQNTIKKVFGFSQRKLDNALWLGRHVTQIERLDACKHWFGISVTSISKLRK